ncbi:DUF6443 domain-containing protein [Ferruginibacter sp. HRS2-29]|uniref:DUF6443 domain-containing protein n=2 Tax=Ferruginibacter sp. HRS2-29 TaxID=2487334 RepID=UPI0020CE6FF2|nr:DUF6443 domain-containing protein [Ferruginibacter sp. HRS2-29]MCP9750370.1 hypothetical protein [Ferruginibacter sp. HRS2-29]
MLKKLIVCGILSVASFSIYAQNLPSGVTAPASATAKKLPPAFAGSPTDNYLRTFVPQVPIQDSSLIKITTSVDSVLTTISFADSYGRNIQTVAKQTSPNKKDNVTTTFYDEFGKTSIEYLPFASTSNDGVFKTNPFQQDSTFYKGIFSNEQIFYNQTLYDGSPLGITVKNLPQGNSWGGAGIGITFGHRANTIADSVVQWVISINTEDDVPVKSAFYSAGILQVEEMTDERGIKAVKYINERGQIILSKTQLASSPGTAHVGWLCTYYVYDEIGKLRMVIPPKATDALNSVSTNWNFSTTPSINTSLCYSYFYDDKGRCTMKRIPGKGKSYTAYDLYDREVMSQDSLLRSTNQWAFVIYDLQGRPSSAGVITSVLSKDTILSQAARSTAYPVLTGTYTIRSQSYYDDYSWIYPSGTSLNNTLETSNITGSNFITTYNSSPKFAQQIVTGGRIRGMLTGMKKIIINTSNYLFDLYLYDANGHIIQKKQTNYSGGTDVNTTQYDFVGRTLVEHQAHQKSGTLAQTHTILTKYSYDHIGRTKSVSKNFDGLGDKTILQKNYDEQGQLQAKVIGNGIETQNFTYNIRGWVTSINKDHVNNTSQSAFFGEVVSYDYGFSNSQLNGNKAGIKWRATGDSNVRAFGFAYDNLNRLTGANYSQQNSGSSSWTNDKADFSVSNLSYDANGNILTMSQRGLQIGTSALIDSLKYTYFTNSNQLQKVSDYATAGGNLGDFKDSSNTGDDYTYDANGNINRDYNRRMHTTSNNPGAVFNNLDKADSIVIAGKATTYYYYDAGGAMLGKKVNTYTASGKVVKNYQYLGDFVYYNDTLQYAMIEGGRIRYAQKRNSITGALYYAYEYDYFISDHMGNVRSIVTEGRDTSTYKATMELANQTMEDALFTNEYTPVNTVINKVSGFDTDTSNHRIVKINSSGNKTGPGIVLKVMVGDKVQISSYAFYNTPTQNPSGVNLLSDILTSLTGGVITNSGGKLLPGNSATVNSALSPNVTNFLNSRSYDNSRPKAYLNWILFDNQFNFVSSNSGVMQVLSGSSKQALVPGLQTMNKSGYLYVYVSNESPQDVYFDDITIKHTTGALVQEQAYYPFGLDMAGLSDKALMKKPTNYKYNSGSELEDEDGLNYYNTFYRKYDPQIGRFTGIDMLAEKTASINCYQYANNNPLLFNDPSGAVSVSFNDILNVLLNSNYGGSWRGGTLMVFGSEGQAFGAGAAYMTANGLWGSQAGWANSFEAALKNFGGVYEGDVRKGFQNGIESIVKQSIKNGNYISAVIAIRNYYTEIFKVNPNLYRIGTNTQGTWSSTEKDEDGQFYSTFERQMLDAFANGTKYSNKFGSFNPTFNDIIRLVYHEIQIHNSQNLGLPGFSPPGDNVAARAAREMEAYYRMFTDNFERVGQASLSYMTYQWGIFLNYATVLGQTKPSYQLMTPTDQTKWAKQYMQMVFFVNFFKH